MTAGEIRKTLDDKASKMTLQELLDAKDSVQERFNALQDLERYLICNDVLNKYINNHEDTNAMATKPN
jgi:hypothetical protein